MTTLKIARISLLLAGLLAGTSLLAADAPQTRADAEKVVQGLHFKHGEVELQGGIAKLIVPPEFNFLDGKDAETVLVKLWGNPPSKGILGMLLPSDKGPLTEGGWAVTLSYTGDGYVKDDDAAKINYDDLMKQMQDAARQSNATRARQGYSTVELVGWAEPPHYDAETHKLYWAKEVKFNDNPYNTLNYNIRILGRRGVLVLNVIAPMSRLADVQERAPSILGMVNFNDGDRYADFNPKVDKVATYGIAALVAGGVAAKLGFFKLIWVFILAAKKFVILAFVAIAAWFKRMFGGKSKGTSA